MHASLFPTGPSGPSGRAAIVAGLVLLAAAAAGSQSVSHEDGAHPTAARLVAGALPAEASPQARAAWQALVAGMAAKSGGRVSAFDIEFDATLYASDKQSNDAGARYRYLDPGFVRMTLESGRERMRGPKGEFLVERGVVQAITRGRDWAEDRRELEQSAAVARTFVGLTDPRALRLARLKVLDGAPQGLPEGATADAPELVWLSLDSPDFRGVRAAAGAPAAAEPLDRVDLGLDARTHRPQLAIVRDQDDPAATLLVKLSDWRELDGFLVPHYVRTWRSSPERPAATFDEKPALDLWLKRGTLRPKLAPDDFLPPQR